LNPFLIIFTITTGIIVYLSFIVTLSSLCTFKRKKEMNLTSKNLKNLKKMVAEESKIEKLKKNKLTSKKGEKNERTNFNS